LKKSSIFKTLVVLGVAAFLILFGITEAEASNHRLTRTLRRGMRGQDVAVVQRLLKDEGIYRHPEITSFFGDITHRAVREFQRRNRLAVDGIIGPRTRRVMNTLLDKKDAASRALRSNVHIVQPNDTMWMISRRYGVTLKSLLDANGMTERTEIRPGQRITIPSASLSSRQPTQPRPTISFTTHIVAAGDTMWSLSYAYGIPATEIAAANNLGSQAVLNIGQSLRIPRHSIPVKPTPGDRYGELLEWRTEAQYVFHLNAVATVTDFLTGISFNIRRTYGSGHADVEPLTAQDTQIMQSIWQKHERLPNGTVDFWAPRAVIVQVGNRRLAASANGMLHAGSDSHPAGDFVNWRSADFGPGYNLDMIKGNGAHGHFCIHFLNSNRHSDGQIDAKHQAMVRIAAGK
jgi:LysM repeat protein